MLAHAGTVSVVIPTYNRGRLITAAIDSVLAQQRRPLEILVIDDGSTDDTETRLAPYRARIRYIRQDNHGAGAARNLGIQEARGDYIAFLDSDDIWLPGKLAMQCAIMDARPDIALLCSDFLIRRSDGSTRVGGVHTWLERPMEWDKTFDEKCRSLELDGLAQGGHPPFTLHIGDIYGALLGHIFVLTSSCMVRREALAPEMRFAEDLPLFEDWEFFARVARARRCAYMDTPTTINRGHDDAVRLTRCDPVTKARTRLALIDRLWAHDPEPARHGLLRQVRAEQWLILAKQAMLAHDPAQARQAVREYLNCRGRRFPDPVWPVAALAWIPPLGQLVARVRRSRERERRP